MVEVTWFPDVGFLFFVFGWTFERSNVRLVFGWGLRLPDPPLDVSIKFFLKRSHRQGEIDVSGSETLKFFSQKAEAKVLTPTTLDTPAL